MPIPKKVLNFLEKAKINPVRNSKTQRKSFLFKSKSFKSKISDGVKYEPIEHRQVFTAYDKAATLKVPQKIIGKTLVVKIDNRPALALVPANKNLDIQKLKKVAKAKKADFIKEAWMKKNLKGVKVGAVPAFGNLWRFPTFVDKTLLKEPKIIINAGDYNWSIKIASTTLKKIIPDLVIGNFSAAKK